MAKQTNCFDKNSPEYGKALEVRNFLKTVSDTNRLRILCLLGEGTLTVSEIHGKLKLPQNLTSHHISKLKGMGLLNEKREGTFRHYSVNIKKMKEYEKMFREVMGI